MRRDYMKMFLEFVFNGVIATLLSYLFQFHDWNKALTFGLTFGILMTFFYTYILPRFKK